MRVRIQVVTEGGAVYAGEATLKLVSGETVSDDRGPQEIVPRDTKGRSGATGGIRQLADDGKLSDPRTAAEIIDLLKQEGRHYRADTVMMGLINLVRARLLTRFREAGQKKWKYVVRR